MIKNEALKYICNIPLIYHADGKISYRKLFTKAVKFIKEFEINRSDLVNYLKNNPSYIEIWHEYAQNKRGAEAYYLSYENNIYSFGFMAKKTSDNVVFKVSEEPYELCAEFVLKDCEYISTL